MKEALKKYKKGKIKRLYVDFYLKDEELYKYAKSINFAKFVKLCLKCELIDKKAECAISLNEEDYE